MEEPTPTPNLISVWASVNLAGLPRGESALVDASDPEIADLIAHRILVPYLADERVSSEQLDVTFSDPYEEAEESVGDVPIPGIADEETYGDSPQAAAS